MVLDLRMPTQQEDHEALIWQRFEIYELYVKWRQQLCCYIEILDLWLKTPLCEECACIDPYLRYKAPDITSSNWEADIEYYVSAEALNSIKKVLEENEDFFIKCRNCYNELMPWKGDFIHVDTYHLEEHFGISLETLNRKNPSRELKKQIINLYGCECFNCKAKNREDLHIDHIMPRSKGGDSAFRNLQPLCSECGNKKGSKIPKVVQVYLDTHFIFE